MFKKIVIILLIFITTINVTVNATTIIGVIGKNRIILTSDTRLTITKVDGEKNHDDNGKKLFRLNNGVGVAFAGDTNSSKKLRSGKPIVMKSVTTIVNDINSMEKMDKLTVEETAELIAEKYVNLLTDYSGEILVAGFEKDEPVIYGIRVIKGNAAWQGIKGRGSFWAIGSGCNILMNKIKNNLECDDNTTNMEIGLNHFAKLDDKKLEKLLRKSLSDVIKEYDKNYDFEEQNTGGQVDVLIIKS